MTLAELAGLGADPSSVGGGLLGPFLSFIDNRKRGLLGLLGDPGLRATQVNEDARAFNRDNRSMAGAQQSVIPEVRDYAAQRSADQAMNMGGLLGITAYHGSPHAFDRFDMGKAGSTTDEGHLGRGMYFSTDPKGAIQAKHMYEVDADIKKPLEIAMPNWQTDKRTLVRKALGLPADAKADDISAALRKAGHDSVSLDYSPVGYNHKEFMVLDDDRLKILKRSVKE